MDNLLWKDVHDRDLLGTLKCYKRESRMEHDNSEDAVTWNVFRYLEKTDQLSSFLSWMTDSQVGNAELIYWSYYQQEPGVWPELLKARKEFGEHSGRGTEPDLIIVTDHALFLVEAKLTATNKIPRDEDGDRKKYEKGGNDWFQQVFKSDFQTVAVKEKKYELMRMWLMGSWAAAQVDRRFYLVNLVRAESEKDIEQRFGSHLKMNAKRCFVRWTWEDIYDFVSKSASLGRDKQKLTTYFENKTIGYKQVRGSETWELQLGFLLTRK
tara:strand:- start:45 stop:845 length:801 start_codon:yes stop_codon:yes gene_type:complete